MVAGRAPRRTPHRMVFMAGGYRRSKADTGKIVTALEAKLGEFTGEDSLANAETWL